MAPLACDPAALDRTGATVVAAGVTMGSAITDLVAALSGSKGMAGDDPVGASVGRAYDGAAGKVIQAMADARNGLCSIGDGVRVSAHNYAVANASSDVTGRAAGLPQPEVTGPLIAGAVPSAVGAGTGAPAGWGWVEPYIGMIWPTGDSAKLRTAAGAWTKAWVSFVATEVTSGGPAMAVIAGQRIPEGDAIVTALTEATKTTTNVGRQCQTIATQLNSYADHVDQVHTAIVDLLSRICDPMTGIKEVWDLLTDEDEDEIKRIADDIQTVVDNFAHEAEALAGEIRNAMAAAAAAAKDMAHWADKEWDHFLHATPVGKAVNQVGQAFEGLGQEGWEFVKGLWSMSPNRLLTDPDGYGKDMSGMAQGLGSLVGLGPDGGPGVTESWKELGKDLSHWDEWSKNPAKALGKSTFDVLTLALPGGPLSKLGKTGHAAADAVKGLKKPPELKPPTVKPPADPAPSPPKPPESPGAPKPPEPGQPAPAPQGKPAPSGKPAPGPADGPLPHSPTESQPPPAAKPPAGEAPKAPAAPSQPHGQPQAPPVHSPGEHFTPPHPQSGEPSAPPTPKPPGVHPPEATPPPARAPHLPPPITPTSVPHGLPVEASLPPSELPLGSEASPRPPELPRLPDGPPVPVDGGGPPPDPVPAETHPAESTPAHNGPVTGHGNQPPTGAPLGAIEVADQATDEVVISGHGGYSPIHGPTVVPHGTTVIAYAEHGSSITDALGNLIETRGDTSRVFSQVFYAGESLPDYTIFPPDGLNILGDPRTVLIPTRLSELLEDNMGRVHLAVCTYDGTCPTGKLYDVEGIWDESTGELSPYERHGEGAG
ncbi:putative adhesin [Mycobacterium sp. E2462]|uniref:putative adhesin n=1 Tax=Mycobacterium sp. E2462 TaxID=1834133 RepID=UPI0009EDBAE1|nr:NAD(+)--arginine ADP-ribosyltransferase [Mycobacterium sp. E2462]